MSFFNWLETEWTCPFCGTKQASLIDMRYGWCDQKLYRVGDAIDFSSESRDGKQGQPRLPNGSGIIIGTAFCVNSWLAKWNETEGASGASAPSTVSERKKYGCPSQLNINIQIKNDVITRVFFSDSDVIRNPEGW